MDINAVIFDLDGVIVSPDESHYQAWKRVSDEEGIYFDREINERLRGVSRMESLEIVLEKSSKVYLKDEKFTLAERKNEYYKDLIGNLKPADILPGVNDFLEALKVRNIKTAIASSSKNTPLILERIGMTNTFDAVADGNDIKDSKPDPEVFLLAAERVGVSPQNCLVVEDADAGIDGALAGGMRVLGVGFASKNPHASFSAADLASADVTKILGE